MKALSLPVLALFLSSSTVYCQQPKLQWQRTFGGDTTDVASSVIATKDSQFAFVGYAFSANDDVIGNHGNADLWLVKFDRSGNLLWQKCLGGKYSEVGADLIATADGGYVLLGFAQFDGGDVSGVHGNLPGDIWVVKLNASGTIAWQKCFGGTSGDVPASIIQTIDGGYLFTGRTMSSDGDVLGYHGSSNSDIWVVKIDTLGAIKWQKCLGGSYDDGAFDVIQTLDSDYVVAGYTESSDGDVSGSHGNREAWVVKLSPSGGLQWQKCFGGSANEEAVSIIQTPDRGFAIAGVTASSDGDVSDNHGQTDAWFVKLGPSGDLETQKCFGGTLPDGWYSLMQNSAGDYIFSGQSYSSDGDLTENFGSRDGWILCTDASGVTKWQKSVGGIGEDHFFSLITTAPEEYIVTGYTRSNNITPEYHGRSDAWIVKLGPTSGVGDDQPINLGMICVPNPAKSSTIFSYYLKSLAKNVTISVSNSSGVSLMKYNLESVEAGRYEKLLDISDFASGSYFISLTVDGLSKTCPLQIIK